MTSSWLWPFSSSAASRRSERQEGRKRQGPLRKQGKEGGQERGGEENVDTNVRNKGDEDGGKATFKVRQASVGEGKSLGGGGFECRLKTLTIVQLW